MVKGVLDSWWDESARGELSGADHTSLWPLLGADWQLACHHALSLRFHPTTAPRTASSLPATSRPSSNARPSAPPPGPTSTTLAAVAISSNRSAANADAGPTRRAERSGRPARVDGPIVMSDVNLACATLWMA
jgi:hypothetical protein